MFADDYLTMEDDEEIASHMLMMNDEGQICSLDRLAPAHSSSLDADRLSINQTVQCNECYR
jgi:hypothetical protein